MALGLFPAPLVRAVKDQAYRFSGGVHQSKKRWLSEWSFNVKLALRAKWLAATSYLSTLSHGTCPGPPVEAFASTLKSRDCPGCMHFLGRNSRSRNPYVGEDFNSNCTCKPAYRSFLAGWAAAVLGRLSCQGQLPSVFSSSIVWKVFPEFLHVSSLGFSSDLLPLSFNWPPVAPTLLPRRVAQVSQNG